MAWAILLLCALGSFAWAATYYVDPIDGSDAGDGSTGDPWKTLVYAANQLAAGDTLKMRGGDYGDVTLPVATMNFGTSENWITYEAESGESPVLGQLICDANPGATRDYYITFRGFQVNGLVRFRDAYNVILDGLTVVGTWDEEDSSNTTPIGIYFIGTLSAQRWNNITIRNCDVSQVYVGISMEDGNYELSPGSILIEGNYVHKIAGSAIRLMRTATSADCRITVQDNHIYNQDTVPYLGESPHGSGISIRARHVTVRRNVIHAYGNTRGIRTYQNVFDGYAYISGTLTDPNTPFTEGELVYQGVTLVGRCAAAGADYVGVYLSADGLSLTKDALTGDSSGAELTSWSQGTTRPWGGYVGMIFDNNLIYDTRNLRCVELVDIAGDVVLRNNTFTGMHDPVTAGALWYYYMSLALPPYSDQGTAPTVKNNIIVGQLTLGTGMTKDNVSNNIMYALYAEGQYWSSLAGNVIVTDNSTADRVPYFEAGDQENDVFAGGPLWDTWAFVRDGSTPHGYDITAGFLLTANSPAYNYGDADVAVAAGAPCGVTAADGFLTPSPYTRSASLHSAGCFETQVQDSPTRYFLWSR